MKKIIIILVTIISTHCKAQSPVIDLQARDGSRVQNAYYKDVNNILNPFEGTWLYTNGTTSLKIVLVKRNMKLLVTYYEDILIGEYQYIENGVEKFNSLSNLNAVLYNEYRHKIVGNHIHTRATPFNETTPGEKILDLYFKDNMGGSIMVRKKMIGSQEAIQILKRSGTVGARVGDLPITAIVPEEEYVLIKQP